MSHRGVISGSLDGSDSLRQAVSALEVEGPVALVTAGWQEYESNDEEMPGQLGRPIVNLKLYERAEAVFAEDKELAEAHRSMQELMRMGQDYYRIRVARMVDAALDIARRAAGSKLEDDEAELSMEYLRQIDRDHLERTQVIREEFEDRFAPVKRPSVAKHREELKRLLSDTKLFALAGGHVAVLLNRLRLFGVKELIGTRPVIAWGGGAMVAAERVLLFHEDPPQGEGVSELLENGLCLHRGVIALPSPRRRLKLDDRYRVSWLARRHQPQKCVALERGSKVFFQGQRWYASHGTKRLETDGSVNAGWTS